MKSTELSLLYYLLPFTYFLRSRLNSLKEWVFHGYNEWWLNLLMLWYASGYDAVTALWQFAISYALFISFYEIGYIANDFYAVRNEANPRMRFGNREVSNGMLTAWIVARVVIFLGILWYLGFPVSALIFYANLGLVFTLHNVLSDYGLKTFTFLQLALFRFWAPVFLFLPWQLMAMLFPVISFYYVFNRTLTYMDSKDLLKLPQRTTLAFKLNSFLILASFTSFWSYQSSSWLPLLCAGYFILFWALIRIMRRSVAVAES